MEKKYIYIVKNIYKFFNNWYSFFENYDEMVEYIKKQMPTLVEENNLDNEIKYKYFVTRIPEDEYNKVTYGNIENILNNGRIEFYEEYNEDDELCIQPLYVYDSTDDYQQQYTEFFYIEKNWKFLDSFSEFDTLEEMTESYFYDQTI